MSTFRPTPTKAFTASGLSLVIFLLCTSINAQQDDQISEIEFPFGPPGAEVSRGVFGQDDRREASEMVGYETLVRATAVMVDKRYIRGNRIYGITLRERLENKFNTNRFHQNVKFLDQPAIANCTGFLIGPDLLATAGHCIENIKDAEQYVWVFDYTNVVQYDPDGNYIEVPPENIFSAKELLVSQLDDDKGGIDYAVLRLDRKSDREPYAFRTSGTILEKTPVYTIGSPTGLPLKFVDNARVTSTSENYWFKSDMDVFPGNSGGPVFDSRGFIEGIMVRTTFAISNGESTGDYYYDERCRCIRTLEWSDQSYGLGSSAHRITKMPPEVVLTALYENILYAIETHSQSRLESWLDYKWMLTYPYTRSRGGFELWALEHNNDSALETILEITSAEIDEAYGAELLQKAISVNSASGLKMLLDHDIYVDAGGDKGYTPLVSTIAMNKPQLAEILLAYGANAQVPTYDGGNLLHLAATTGNYALADLLIRQGVSPHAKNNRGRRPEKVARKSGYKGLGKYLKRVRKRGQ